MVGIHDHSIPEEPTLFTSDSEFGIDPDRLDPVIIKRNEPEARPAQPVQSVRPTSGSCRVEGDHGLVGLLEHLAPNNRDMHVPPVLGPIVSANPSSDTVMIDQSDRAEANEASSVQDQTSRSVGAALEAYDSHGLNARDLREKATAGLREHEAAAQARVGGVGEGGTMLEKRHDSHQEQEAPLSPSRTKVGSCRGSPSLKIDTNRNAVVEESITTSPNLGKYVITMADDRPETLPAFHHSSKGEGGAASPQGATLPPIHQIVPTQHLHELAEAATQQDPRYAHHQSPSYGSATSLSPVLPYHPYPGTAHMSPSSQQAYSARSSISGFGDPYGSPTQYAHPVAYYTTRRSSAPFDRPPPLPASIPSVSSSGDSHGPSSSIDGYSTAHTTPIDAVDGTPRPMLPPPPGMVIAQSYKCDVPDCPAPSFQTQYLLSSHKNVHTNLRPHYCPVEGCARGEGGRGFKRKNEMIRHGLVHDSPGYVCPFCPDREHRYPRPDNLQRHVRVHHVDKDRDDADLRTVLAQRSQRTGKSRRRRATTGGSGS